MKVRVCKIMQPLDAAKEMARFKEDRSVAGWEWQFSRTVAAVQTLRVWFIDGSAWMHSGYYWAAELPPRKSMHGRLPWESDG